MKSLLRNFLINLGSLWVTTQILPGLVFNGGFKALATASFAFMIINSLVVPILRIMFLPLNLLTLGVFSWAVNVLALYFLVAIVPQFKIVPYYFQGANLGGFLGSKGEIVLPALELNVLFVAIIASFLIGLMSHILHWIVK